MAGRRVRTDKQLGAGAAVQWPVGVKTGKAQCEHMFSALPSSADMQRPKQAADLRRRLGLTSSAF